MRPGIVLAMSALAAVLAGCRRAEPATPAPPAIVLPAAVESAPPPPAKPGVNLLEAAPAASATVKPAEGELAVVPLPPPAAATAASGPAAPEEEPEDPTLYSWEDASGGVNFGTRAQLPAHPRHLRRVDAGVSVIPSTPIDLPQTPTTTAAAPATAAPAAAAEPGDQPHLDADGLPIPGTMKDTAHTRAVRAATGRQLDPASAERAHQEELRKLNCRVVDGATICG
jgi:hypothetical protein